MSLNLSDDEIPGLIAYARGKFAAWLSIARSQWLAASRTDTPGTAAAPWELPPAPQKKSISVRLTAGRLPA